MKETKVKEPIRIRTKKLSNGSQSIFLDIYINGKRRREYLKIYLIPGKTKEIKAANATTLQLANAIKAKRIVQIQNSEYGFKNNTIKAKTNLIGYVLFLADEALAKSGNKRSYYYTLHSLANHLNCFAGDKITFQQVDHDFVKRFIVYLRSAKNFNLRKKEVEDGILSPNTQHNLFKKFTYVIKKAIQAEIIQVNPLDKIDSNDKPKGEDGTREFLTIEEMKKLIQTPCKDDMIKRAFLFCCLCGIRYSDVHNLTWGQFYKDNDGETILRLKVTKTKRNEDFPISNEALKWLPERNEASDDENVFILPKNDHANRKLRVWSKETKITKRLSFHCSRHTAATLNLSLGVPIETVSKLLGHTKISTTLIYAKIIDQKKKEAVKKQEGLFD